MADFDTAWYRQYTKDVLAVDDTCHLCRHPGSDVLDHIIPRKYGGTEDPTNLAPAHHIALCPICGVRCNRRRGARVLPSAHRSRDW